MTFIQLFYMDTNLKSRAKGKRKIGVFRITSIAPLEIGLTDRGTEFSSGATVLHISFFPSDDQCFITYRFNSLSLYPGAAVHANFRTIEEGVWQLTTQHTSDNRKHCLIMQYTVFSTFVSLRQIQLIILVYYILPKQTSLYQANPVFWFFLT